MSSYIGLRIASDFQRDYTYPDLHLTVLYLGEVDEPGVSIMEHINHYADQTYTFSRDEIKMFGPDNDVLAVTLKKSQFEQSWVTNLRDRLLADGYRDASEYDYTPHISLIQKPDSEIVIPSQFTVGAPYLSLDGKRYYGHCRGVGGVEGDRNISRY